MGPGLLERLAGWIVLVVVVSVLLQVLVEVMRAYALWITLALIVLIAGAFIIRRLFY